MLMRGYGNVGNGCTFARCDPGAPAVLLSFVVVVLSWMCSPDECWSSFAVLCLAHFAGSLVWPHRFRYRILHFKYMHPVREIAETQKLSARYHLRPYFGIYVNHDPRREFVSRYAGYKPSNMLSGLKHLRTHKCVGQPLVNVVDWTAV